MTQTKTKKALLMSVLSMVLCVAMLVGMTFAWFTDTASTGVNKIQAGNLDVQLLMRDASGEYQNIGDAENVIFGPGSIAQNNNQETLWEPGKTQVAYLAVRNAENLALKYNIVLNVVDNGLAGALQYVIVPQGKLTGNAQNFTGTVDDWNTLKSEAAQLPVGKVTAAENGCLDEIAYDATKTDETEYFALVVHMDENAGNTYQGKDVSIDLAVVATQKNAESDSFGPDYDKDATYPVVANTQQELDKAIENATNDSRVIITLPNNKTFNLTNAKATNKNVTIIGGNNTVVDICQNLDGESGVNSGMNYQDNANITFEGVTILGQSSGNYGGIVRATTTYNNCKIKGKLTLYGDTTFTNCTFENENDYSIWTWGASNVTFEGCAFNTGGKAINLYGGAAYPPAPTTVMTVNNCVFNDSNNGSKGKAAIEVGNDYSATYILTVNNPTINGFAINSEGTSTGSKIWANKKSMDTDHLSVTINGTKVY